MSMYRAAIIGTGRRGAGRGSQYGIAEAHARAYAGTGVVAVVAAADIDQERLDVFCTEHGIPARYNDYRELLVAERPDLVSVCTWVQLHPDMVIAAAEAGAKGILCEKPMALTLSQADAMLAACKRTGTRLSIDHQRRLGEPFRIAKTIAMNGEIGDLIRIDGYFRSGSLYDTGTHWIDMMFYYLNDTRANWVMSMIDSKDHHVDRGMRVERSSITNIEFHQKIRGCLEIGHPVRGGVSNRILGTKGVIEVLSSDSNDAQTKTVRARLHGRADWIVASTHESIHSPTNYHRAVIDLIQSIEEEREPELTGIRGRATTEVIVAAYESALRRRRVDLPLDVDYSPLEYLQHPS